MRHLCIVTLIGASCKFPFKRRNVMRHLCVLTLTLIMMPIILSADSAETALFRNDLSPTFQEPPLQGVSAGGRSDIGILVRRDDDGNMLSRISILALARSQYTPALPRRPRLFVLNPAHHLRR